MPLKHLQDTTETNKNQEVYAGDSVVPEPEELKKSSQTRKKDRRLADSMKRLGYENKAARIMDCGTQMVYAHILAENRMQLHSANFCRERLCPMCAMHRSRQIFAQVSQVMNAIDKERPGLTPVFLTLTLRNCEAGELSATLDTIFQGWNRFLANKRVKRIIVGWFRALEVTYNEKEDTYHPHVHAILLMPPSYFTTPKDYMTTKQWVASWRKALRLDYDPVCDIRAIDTAADGRSGAVAEVAKYTAKDSDYLKEDEGLTDKLVAVFIAALKGRRLHAFGGLMKETAKRLKLDLKKMVPGEVTDKNGVKLRKDIDYILYMYRWNMGLSRYDFEGRV